MTSELVFPLQNLRPFSDLTVLTDMRRLTSELPVVWMNLAQELCPTLGCWKAMH